MLRVRVPAARDMVELSLAAIVKAETRRLDEAGYLPPKPEGLNLDDLVVTIDPHQSLHAMPDLIQGFETIVDRLGFEVGRGRICPFRLRAPCAKNQFLPNELTPIWPELDFAVQNWRL